MASPAFTSLSTTRRTFGGPSFVNPSDSSQPSPAPTPSRPAPRVWPQAVREYVSRSFADDNSVEGVDKEMIGHKLKEVINQALQSDSLHTADWATVPLPQHILQSEKSQLASLSSTANLSLTSHDQHSSSTNPKKRKSSDLDDDMEADGSAADSVPPWRQTSINQTGFEDRISYSSPGQAKKLNKRQRKFHQETGTLKESSRSLDELEKRRQRFESGRAGFPTSGITGARDDSPAFDSSNGPVVGACQDLEKRYFRLTAPPKPESVRPLPVLRRTLDMLKTKWKNEKNYGYVCDQFKSLRQDLTVQHIKNDFTVNVYEIHARIALERGDMGEYNQCQTQLRALYKQKLGGHPAEFLAYRILYFVYTCNHTDMNDVLSDLTIADRRQHAVRHALETRSALALGNHHRFFKLYMETPNMGSYLMDMFLVRERLAALANICRAYKPDIDLRLVTDDLAFESDQECCEFICEAGGEHLFAQTEEAIRFSTAKAGRTFDAAKAAAYSKVDIKGQV